MRAASAAALTAAQETLRGKIPENWQKLGTIAEGFLDLAEVVRANPRISRALTDPARSGEDKSKLVWDLLSGDFFEVNIEVTQVLAQNRWSDPDDLATALFDLGIESELYAAAAASAVQTVSHQLLDLIYLLEENRELRLALTDKYSSTENKLKLLDELFADSLQENTLALVKATIRIGSRRIFSSLRTLSDRAASMNARTLVMAEASQPLTEEQTNRLVQILEKKYNTEIELNVQIQPDLIGGMLIKSAKYITDGTVRTALARTKTDLAG